MKLKIGAWQKLDGFRTLDIDESLNPHILASVEAIPLKDNSCEHIVCENVLEHVGHMDRAFDEMLRVCEPDGIIEILLPHFSSAGLWTDIQHKRGGSYFMFDKGYKNKGFTILERRIMIEGRSMYGVNKPTRWHKVFSAFEWFANNFPHTYEYWFCNAVRADCLYFKLKKDRVSI